MAAGMDDILTTQKNGVVAINNLATYVKDISGYINDLSPYIEYISNDINGIYKYIKGTNLVRTSMPLSVITLYTEPLGTEIKITDIEICNTASTAATFSIYIVASGESASTYNALFYQCPIPARSTMQWTGSQVLKANGTIRGYASASTVTVMIDGARG